MENAKASLQDFVASGLTGYEPSFGNPNEVTRLKARMDDRNIWAKSMHVISVLHKSLLVEKKIAEIMAIAREAKKMGIDILINCAPVSNNRN